MTDAAHKGRPEPDPARQPGDLRRPEHPQRPHDPRRKWAPPAGGGRRPHGEEEPHADDGAPRVRPRSRAPLPGLPDVGRPEPAD